MNRIIYISVGSSILVGGIWLAARLGKGGSDPKQVIMSSEADRRPARPPTSQDPNDPLMFLEQIRNNEERQIEKEAAQIRQDLSMAAQNSDSKSFGKRLSYLIYEFKGDPRPLLYELVPLLDHEDDYIGMVIASQLLEARIVTDKATAFFLKILTRPGPLIEPKEEGDFMDIRMASAMILSQYPSDEISAAVWDFYQKTRDDRLFDELLRLGNPNLPGEIIPRLNETGVVFDYLGIICQYKIQEAREPLLKLYQNEYFMRKGEGGKRGATLWGLWCVTGDRKYREEFMAAGGGRAVEYFGNEKTDEAKNHLISMLPEESGDILQRVVMSLHINYDDPPELKEYLKNCYTSGGTSPLSIDLLYRLTAAIDDPDLHSVAEKAFPGSEGPRMWRRYGVYRKGWAIPEWTGGSLDIR